MKRKRVVYIGDMHCGHRVGLTPKEYQWRVSGHTGHIWRKYAKIQRECWSWYSKALGRVKQGGVHLLMVGGDCIDGRGEKSKSTELLTTDRDDQVAMAIDTITPWEATHIVMVRGTDYHVGDAEQFENHIAKEVNAKIGDHEWPQVTFGNKAVCTFDLKHHISGSQVPHGRATALGRDELWNALWAEADLQPRGDWIVRGHVHYHVLFGREAGGKMRWMTTAPALQAMGSRFGAKRMSGIVSFGFMWWDIFEDGRVAPCSEVVNISAQCARPTKV